MSNPKTTTVTYGDGTTVTTVNSESVNIKTYPHHPLTSHRVVIINEYGQLADPIPVSSTEDLIEDMLDKIDQLEIDMQFSELPIKEKLKLLKEKFQG